MKKIKYSERDASGKLYVDCSECDRGGNGSQDDRRIRKPDIAWMREYAERFARRWGPYLNEDEVMRADLHLGASGNMIAMEFYPADPEDPWDLTPKKDSWAQLLGEIGKALPRPLGTSQILLDGLVHVITDDGIVIIKRNEKRFWTRSLAREDADAALCKAMKIEIDTNGRAQ